MTAPASHLAIAAALGVAVFTVATAVPVASAQVLNKEVHIDQFAFAPQRVTVKTGTTVTWINDDDIPHTAASSGKLFKSRARSIPKTNSHSRSRRPSRMSIFRREARLY